MTRKIFDDASDYEEEPYSWLECITLLLFIGIVLAVDFLHALGRYLMGRRP